MPKMGIYAIRDSVAEESGPLFVAKNDAVALRQYDALLRDADPKHKDEYELLCVGEYNSDEGTVLGLRPMKIDIADVNKIATMPVREGDL